MRVPLRLGLKKVDCLEVIAELRDSLWVQAVGTWREAGGLLADGFVGGVSQAMGWRATSEQGDKQWRGETSCERDRWW